MTKFNRHLQQCCEAYNITKSNCTDTCRHVCSETYKWQNWTDTCSSVVKHTISQSQTAQTLADMYAVKHTNDKIEQTPAAVLWSIQYHKVKLHRHLQTCMQWNIQMTKQNRHLQQCCEAYNITKSNCTDTNRHVCSETYNYKIEQRPAAVLWSIQYHKVKLHRHLH